MKHSLSDYFMPFVLYFVILTIGFIAIDVSLPIIDFIKELMNTFHL